MARPNTPTTRPQATEPATHATPTTCAWVAEAWSNAAGEEVAPQSSGGGATFAVSVHEEYPATEAARLQLLGRVGQQFRNRVPAGAPSLWVFPGGFFGFNAAVARTDQDRAWHGFDASVVERELPDVLSRYPANAIVAFGADGRCLVEGDACIQEVWIARTGNTDLQKIRRGATDLSSRCVQVGPVLAAFFVCGEFTGSWTDANGPYCENLVLDDPVRQLSDCRLLVDLAHSRVKGVVNGSPGRRQVHARQVLRFAQHGAAVLTHHHGGNKTYGRPRNDSQSNWVVFRGGAWLSGDRVTAI